MKVQDAKNLAQFLIALLFVILVSLMFASISRAGTTNAADSVGWSPLTTPECTEVIAEDSLRSR